MVGATPNHLRAQFTSDKVKRLRIKIEKVMKDLPEELRDLVMRHQFLVGSPHSRGIGLRPEQRSKEEFKDGVRLRYDLPIPDLPSNCVCGDNFTVEHALSCNKGGFINQRHGHDNIRDLFVCLLKRVCPNVKQEPHLTLVTGETFAHDTAITDPGARLDIKAQNFWRRGQNAFFETKVTFYRHEERKKRNYMERCLYVEHATFTPLVIGTNGGMGDLSVRSS